MIATRPSSTASVVDIIPASKTSYHEEEPEIAVHPLLSIDFKCDQCDYVNVNAKGLSQHKRMKHRMSQLDGVADPDEELTKDTTTVINSMKVESEQEKSDKHIKLIPLEKLKSLTAKELSDLQADITRKVLQEMKANVISS